MALPSGVTIGSIAFVVAAGVGLVTVASSASENHTTLPAGPTNTPSSITPQKSESPAVPKHVKGKSEAQHGRDRPGRVRANPTVPPRAFVEVYNNSGITGLASDKAEVLELAGWNVTATDNWYGNIPENTVYYPDELRVQARMLARVLHITRTRPAVSPMQFDRLTVIFTSP